MASVLILVDFDNFRSERLERAISQGNPTVKDYEDTFQSIVHGVIDNIPLESCSIAEFRFRFYGGWSSSIDGDETEACAMLTKIVANAPRRPNRGLRLSFELARSPLFLSDMRFEDTSRERPWAGGGIKIDPTFRCASAGVSDCASVASLKSWLKKGRCSTTGCSIKLGDFTKTRGQKLVDTHIVADAIVASTSEQWQRVVIVSADDDMVPGLVFRRPKACEMSLVRMNYQATRGRYDQLLNNLDIAIYDL